MFYRNCSGDRYEFPELPLEPIDCWPLVRRYEYDSALAGGEEEEWVEDGETDE